MNFLWLAVFSRCAVGCSFKIFVDFSFGHVGSSLLLGLFSSCSMQRLLPSCGAGLLISVAFSLQSTGSRQTGFSSVAHGPSGYGTWASFPRGVWDLPVTRIKSLSLHWQADSVPLSHQGSLRMFILTELFFPLCFCKISQTP